MGSFCAFDFLELFWLRFWQNFCELNVFLQCKLFSRIIFSLRIFDKDDDGLISVEELRHIMLSFGEKMTEKELDEMVAEANCDKDGHIDYEGEHMLMSIDVIHLLVIMTDKK